MVVYFIFFLVSFPLPPSVVFLGGADADHLMELLRGVTEEAVQVADEPVDVTLAGRLVDDVLVVVVTQAAAELLVVHLGLVLPLAPPPGDLVGVREFELPAVPGPADDLLARLVGQEFEQKLPQLDGTAAYRIGRKKEKKEILKIYLCV